MAVLCLGGAKVALCLPENSTSMKKLLNFVIKITFVLELTRPISFASPANEPADVLRNTSVQIMVLIYWYARLQTISLLKKVLFDYLTLLLFVV